MELRQLRYFVAVAEEGNISRAAKKIFLTQPALSRQIKALEDEIGLCLLERQAHSIRLTPTGEALHREGRALLDHAEQLLQQVRAVGRSVRLRVGYAPSLATGILSVAMENFAQTHPGARIELFDLATNEILIGLKEDRLDAAVTVGHLQKAAGVLWTPLSRATWQLAVGQNHRFSSQVKVTPAEIAREPLLAFCRKDYPEYWEMIIEWFRAHRLRPRLGGEYDGVDSLLAAVESGLGVALVTTRVAGRVPKRVKLRALVPAPEPLCIAAGRPENQTGNKPLAVFIEELRKAALAGT